MKDTSFINKTIQNECKGRLLWFITVIMQPKVWYFMPRKM